MYIYPSQRTFSKSIVFSVGIRHFSVNRRAKRIIIYAFVDLPGLMWTGQGNEMATGSEALAYIPRLVEKKDGGSEIWGYFI